MSGKHELARIIPEDGKTMAPSRDITIGHGLQAEIRSLKLERDGYRVKYGKARSDVALLQTQLDELNDQVSDLRRTLEHAREARRVDPPRQDNPQVVLTSPVDIVKVHRAAQCEHEDDNEIEFIGISPAIGQPKVEKVAPQDPRVSPLAGNFRQSLSSSKVPCVSVASRSNNPVKHEQRPNELDETRIDWNGDARSAKRRKIDSSSAPVREATPRNVDRMRDSTESSLSSITSSASLKKDTQSNGTSSRTMSETTREAIASSSKVKLPDSPNSVNKPSKATAALKIKQEAFILPPSLVFEYLSTCKPLDITPPPSPLCVPRQFIRLMYGGSDQQFLQYILPSRNPSGPQKRRMVFPMFDMNPSMPPAPGEPGLVYASRHEILENPPWTLFSKDATAKKAVWRYLGEYESELCGKMSPELFRNQQQVVKQTWGELIMKTKQWPIYVAMRARVALRKAGIPLLIETVEEEVQKIRGNNGRFVTVNDIISAFECGEEAIDILKMQCTFYDRTFMKDMETKFQDWKPEAKQAEATERLKITGEQKRGGQKGARNRTQRFTMSEANDGMSEEDDNSHLGQHGDSSARYSLRIRNRTQRFTMSEASDDMSEDDDGSHIGQHGDSDKRHALRRSTRSRWDVSTGTRLPVRAGGEMEEDVDYLLDSD